MEKFREILRQYWGYDNFRPLQDKIIQSVAAGNDTLGLMPTGGGKSITFQVPAMAKDGVCIVVTPLIALMKDQVENLRRRHIKATAVYSGMTREEIVAALENCILGDYKFLYISPERIGTEIFKTKLAQMTVSYLVVDESHCISQWGYDFRPAYLQIARIREMIPDAPVLAVTATATPEVVDDIQEKLLFKKKNVFQKSFSRKNLIYIVKKAEDKNRFLLKILQKVPGCGIVYVRNRKKTKEISDFLNQNGITADYFHAGLAAETKDRKQERWKNDKCRIIVSTNAFGMGIDKPDVRVVVHIDLPDSLEAYFQEAGRGGRDEKKAYAVLLYSPTDDRSMKKRFADAFPEKKKIVQIYNSLGNYLEIAAGSGGGRTYNFDLAAFCAVFHFPLLTAHNALKILEQAGYIEYSEDEELSSRFMFCMQRDELYRYKSPTDDIEQIIYLLLRKYSGTFSDFAFVDEETLAREMGKSRDEIYNLLIAVAKIGIIKYVPGGRKTLITFAADRQLPRDIVIGKDIYEEKQKRHAERMESVLEYAQNTNTCRSRILLSYFGERDADNCGCCDICLTRKKSGLTSGEFSEIRENILRKIGEKPLPAGELSDTFINIEEEKILRAVRFLAEQGEIATDADGRITIPERK